jgi:tRNA uridine 5-carbamoylmethylation protein Kti12
MLPDDKLRHYWNQEKLALERSKEDDSAIIDENFKEVEVVKKPKSSKRKTALPDAETTQKIIPEKNVKIQRLLSGEATTLLNKKQRPEAKIVHDVDLKVRRKSYMDYF